MGGLLRIELRVVEDVDAGRVEQRQQLPLPARAERPRQPERLPADLGELLRGREPVRRRLGDARGDLLLDPGHAGS